MTKKTDQTFFLTSYHSKLYNDLERIFEEQQELLKDFVKQRKRPSNDIWIAYFSNYLGKLARSIEDNDAIKTKKLITTLIAQLIAWLDFLEDENFDEQILETKQVYNPTYNTILVKLMGILSTKVLKNNNKEISANLRIINSYCTQWLERLKKPKIKILEKEIRTKAKEFTQKEEFTTNLAETLSTLDLD